MSRESKTISFEIKADGITTNAEGQEVGKITAYGAVFNNIDEGNDRITSGAFTRTIKNSKARAKAREKEYLLKMFWQHNTDEVIGSWTDMTEDTFGLLCKGDVLLATQRGREYYELAKAGMMDDFSIIYEVMPDGSKYEKGTGVRDLMELRLFSIDPVSLPMNDATYTVSVKGGELEIKSVCGNTSGPIGPRDESWSGSAAEKWIWGEALDSDGNVKSAVAKKYFMRLDGDPKLKGSYSYPFWTSGHISVGGVKACANALSGARNADAGGDTAGMKRKVETLYRRINAKYKDDDPLTPPWEGDGKGNHRSMDKKDFHDNYRPRQIRDWKSELYSLVSSFCDTCDDAFKMGDQPLEDIMAALNGNDESPGFIAEVQDWIAEGIELDYSNYLDEMQNGSSPYGSGYYGYMADDRERFVKAFLGKAMTASDATTGGFTTDQVDKLKNAASKAMQKTQDHADALHEAADTVKSLVSSTKALMKAGRTFSSANVQKLSDHADDLDDKADSLTKSMKRSTNSINTVADDLATILQGSAPTYTSDPGTPASGHQEGKSIPYPWRTHAASPPPSSQTAPAQAVAHMDTAEEDELTQALSTIRVVQKA